MSFWLTGDLHVHSNHDSDGFLSVAEVVERSRAYCDFLAISGHALLSDNWGVDQYASVLAAREANPGLFIFHTGEWEFPVPRHTIVLTTPDQGEFELQRELVRRFDRRAGVVGRERALEGLRYIEGTWGEEKALMIFNHPDSPAVPLDDLVALAGSPVFKIMACYDRGERRASQTWEVGAEWDQLLMRGHRLWVRFGSDFHKHFTDGHTDYYPGEFVQDQVKVQEKSYQGIFDAYRTGNYFCTVDNLIHGLEVRYEGGLHVSFQCREEVEYFEIIGDGRVLETISPVPERFDRRLSVPPASYYRLRGHGREKTRKYSAGTYRPVFMSNPVFISEAS